MTIHSLNSSAPSAAPVGSGAPLSPAEAAAQADSYLGYLAMLVAANDPALQPEIDRIKGILTTLQGEVIDPTVSQLISQGLNNQDFVNWWKNGSNPPPCSIAYNWLTTNPYKVNSNSSPDTYFAYVMFMISTESEELWSGGKQRGVKNDFDTFLNTIDQGTSNYEKIACFLRDYVYNRGGVIADGTLSTLLTDTLNLNSQSWNPIQLIGDAFTGNGPAFANDPATKAKWHFKEQYPDHDWTFQFVLYNSGINNHF